MIPLGKIACIGLHQALPQRQGLLRMLREIRLKSGRQRVGGAAEAWQYRLSKVIWSEHSHHSNVAGGSTNAILGSGAYPAGSAPG
ncbi:MAG: hypothetical protein ETSY2_17650 [Candidatus Entotheonella gemina]|uniref:Uncharacterized protein n=1 Tax=Candidatus Entotheonella gemina TaxID=1429439 RepID=W4M9R5_9BACT|nr:MAG: hypothetical protein ETSY2_17650 [Candidatus Entotheonella gemina]